MEKLNITPFLNGSSDDEYWEKVKKYSNPRK